MYHEVMRPSATFATTISQAAELRGICYLGSLLLFPHLDSYTSLRHHPPPSPELTGTSGDEWGVSSEILASSKCPRWESGDPCNLVGDLCREHREVLLVAFKVGRHGGFRSGRPGSEPRTELRSRGARKSECKDPESSLERGAENWGQLPGRQLPGCSSRS